MIWSSNLKFEIFPCCSSFCPYFDHFDPTAICLWDSPRPNDTVATRPVTHYHILTEPILFYQFFFNFQESFFDSKDEPNQFLKTGACVGFLAMSKSLLLLGQDFYNFIIFEIMSNPKSLNPKKLLSIYFSFREKRTCRNGRRAKNSKK